MSVEELKAVIDGASEEERLFLAAYLRIKNRGGSGPLGIALAEANQRMDAGHSVSLEKIKELHGQLENWPLSGLRVTGGFGAVRFVLSLKRSECARLIRWMGRLKNLPFTEGQLTVLDAAGREIKVSNADKFLVYHWTDIRS